MIMKEKICIKDTRRLGELIFLSNICFVKNSVYLKKILKNNK